MNDHFWYKNAIIYGLDLERFQDSNGDGIGDLQGAIKRLPYLHHLGINCLWLLPFFPTPGLDNGYDIKNYYDVNPDIGTMQDFQELIHRSGELGIRIMIDLVVNHTSDQHPWFLAARHDPKSQFHSYYLWSKQAPLHNLETTFAGQISSAWNFDEIARKYYYHRFYPFEPQLNFSNPDVQSEVFKIIDFWLSFGISGFRIDAAAHIVEAFNMDAAIPRFPHQFLREMRRFVEKRDPSCFLLAESDVQAADLEDYFGEGDEMNMLFNFLLNNYLFWALAEQKKDPLEYGLGMLPSVPHSGHWANFLRNLDELDLERLPGETRERVMDLLDPEKEARIFHRGLRRRLAPLLNGDQRRIRMAISLMFSMPGSPVIVYGDEIGMGDDLSLKGRNAVRTPMQWSDEKNGGFSSSEHVEPQAISQGDFSYHSVNVFEQEQDPDSLLNWMRKLIAVRSQCPELGWGPVSIVRSQNPGVVAHRCEWRGGHLMMIHNLCGEKIQCALELSHQRHGPLIPLFGNANFQLEDGNHLRLDLEPYAYQWIREGT